MDSFGQMLNGSFVRLFFGFYVLEPTRAISAFDFFLAYYAYLCYTKDKSKRNED